MFATAVSTPRALALVLLVPIRLPEYWTWVVPSFLPEKIDRFFSYSALSRKKQPRYKQNTLKHLQQHWYAFSEQQLLFVEGDPVLLFDSLKVWRQSFSVAETSKKRLRHLNRHCYLYRNHLRVLRQLLLKIMSLGRLSSPRLAARIEEKCCDEIWGFSSNAVTLHIWHTSSAWQ